MIDWIKRVLGFDIVLDLDERKRQASEALAEATSVFDNLVTTFHASADELEEIAADALRIAKEHLAREAEALAEAGVARARGAKIQEFFTT